MKSNELNRNSFLNKKEYSWHNAHLAFSKKDYKKVNHYLLNDHLTNDDVKTILYSHLFFRLKLHDNAEKEIRKLTNNDYSLIKLKSLGDFFEIKNQDSAVVYYESVLKYEKLPEQLLNEVNESLAYINLTKKKFKKAEASYKKLLNTYKTYNDVSSSTRVYANLGNLYFEQYQDLKAKQYFDSAYVTSKSIKNLNLKSSITHNLYIVSEALKEHKQAIKYLKEHNILQDSIQKEATIWKIAEQKEAFNLAKKQAEIDKKTAQRNILIIISIAILLLLTLTFLFYKKLQQKHQQIQILNNELEESNLQKNQMFSIVAHDLRSPVALLKQKLQLATSNSIHKTITIDNNVIPIIDSLSFLLDNLLNWSLSQSNLLAIQKDWFPLFPVINQVAHQYDSLLKEKNIQLSIKDVNSFLIFGDMELFKIVLRNCLDNAIKFTPKNGEILISGIVEGNFLKLSIQDSGVGIPETVLKTLFELHTKKAQKDTEGRKSSGLGLHLVKSMIELNNGTIHIKNHPKGGTVVHISIPHKIIA
ncbi:HAMP domain-containing sensor histidine kinase [Tenacibaculum sp. 190524A02b]|uniref:tetratricopeptide repeat-containing sensor histidine kinase n=1 Tax=Tenacibaculum vairaonense TaxID=3137860 RepID=UPI0031FA6155